MYQSACYIHNLLHLLFFPFSNSAGGTCRLNHAARVLLQMHQVAHLEAWNILKDPGQARDGQRQQEEHCWQVQNVQKSDEGACQRHPRHQPDQRLPARHGSLLREKKSTWRYNDEDTRLIRLCSAPQTRWKSCGSCGSSHRRTFTPVASERQSWNIRARGNIHTVNE